MGKLNSEFEKEFIYHAILYFDEIMYVYRDIYDWENSFQNPPKPRKKYGLLNHNKSEKTMLASLLSRIRQYYGYDIKKQLNPEFRSYNYCDAEGIINYCYRRRISYDYGKYGLNELYYKLDLKLDDILLFKASEKSELKCIYKHPNNDRIYLYYHETDKKYNYDKINPVYFLMFERNGKKVPLLKIGNIDVETCNNKMRLLGYLRKTINHV